MTNAFRERVNSATALDSVVNPNDAAQTGIAAYRKRFELLMPKGADADQLIVDAIQALEAQPKLRECSPQSVLGGLVTISQLGLRPGVLGEAWLLPMWNRSKRSMEATLVVGYQGYLKLAYNSDQVRHVEARTVYESDRFEFSFDHARLVHTPDIDRPRGHPRAWYAVVHLANGHVHVERPMTLQEMQEHRDRYAMAKKKDGTIVGPWASDFDAMARKTLILRALKYLPKSVTYRTAEEVDGGVRTDVRVERQPEHATVSAHDLSRVLETGEGATESLEGTPGPPEGYEAADGTVTGGSGA